MLLLLTLFACSDETVSDVASCDVVLETLAPESGTVGTRVTLTGTPLTSHFDTALYVGGVRADVSIVTRTGCDACDECRAEQACNACEDCDTCDVECRVECEESLEFTVPEAQPGPQTLLLYNAHGSSNTLSFEVLDGSVDTGTTDTGTTDTGTADTGTADTGTTGSDTDEGSTTGGQSDTDSESGSTGDSDTED